MRRRLIALDLVLLAAVGAMGWRLRQNWRQARHREQMVLRHTIKPLPPPPVTPLPPVEPLKAAAYSEIAEKMLFSKDRNPTVVIEQAPPKPMPPLPVLYGVMDIGAGPTAILSEKSGAEGRGYRIGEKIGPFAIVGLNAQEIVFEWEGKRVNKKLEELLDRRSSPGAEAGASPTPRGAAPPPPSPAVASVSQTGPGVAIGGNIRACQPGDDSPAGTVQDGFRKVISDSPFGKVCRWEPVK